ncbi:MAG: glycosyltransferase family 4 protein [Roseiflexus sp.]|nr:glycosyltransferase family 4 protein [Roseiflexus sp.]MCS7291113.1 glycosyltransferase family 4 protein [Roseiflexus sp.]MDW8145859.1 glycosyltransferase family 4 protein [Roseiflexaceae bacterium]
MRILALTSWWPEPADNGSRLRIANLLRALARHHEIHLISFIQEEVTAAQIRKMRELCVSVEVVRQRVWHPRPGEQIKSLWHAEPASFRATWSPEFDQCVRHQAAVSKPDVVVAFQINAARYALGVTGVPRLLEELEVGNIHTDFVLQQTPHRRLRAWLTWQKHTSYVRRLLRYFDACTVVSDKERHLVRAIAPFMHNVHVIPNGTEVILDAECGEPQRDTLIYPGALTFDANFDAVKYFLSDIFPHIKVERPDVRLIVTGRAPLERRAALPQVEGVEFTGYVPDVRPFVARSWCEVVPLRLGGGTRLKVLEALALGTPVVSTPKGVEGLELEHNVHVLIAQTAREFAEATLNLLERPDLRARLALQGRRRVIERYDWRVIGEQLNDLLGAIVERRRAVSYRSA